MKENLRYIFILHLSCWTFNDLERSTASKSYTTSSLITSVTESSNWTSEFLMSSLWIKFGRSSRITQTFHNSLIQISAAIHMMCCVGSHYSFSQNAQSALTEAFRANWWCMQGSVGWIEKRNSMWGWSRHLERQRLASLCVSCKGGEHHMPEISPFHASANCSRILIPGN